MNILFLCSFYPTETSPHHGIFFQDHAQALTHKHTVGVLHVQTPGLKQVKHLQARLYQQRVHEVLEVRSVVPVLSQRFTTRMDKAEKEALEIGFSTYCETQGRPDVLIAQGVLPAGNNALWLSERTGIPYYVIDHYSFLPDMVKTQSAEMRAVYGKAKGLATVSSKHQDIIFSLSNRRPMLIGNVLSQEFERAPFVPAPEMETFRVLFVGYDDPKKGSDILYDVIRASATRSHLNFTLVGNLQLPDDIKPLVSHVESASRTALIQLMQSHHVLLSTSRIETFGMAMVEMLSCGRPVVCTPSGGPEVYIHEKNGMMCANHEVQTIVAALRYVQEHFTSYDVKAIRSAILSKFGSTSFISSIDHLLQHES